MKSLLMIITAHTHLAGTVISLKRSIVIIGLLLTSACSFLGTTDLNDSRQYDTKKRSEQATVKKRGADGVKGTDYINSGSKSY